MKIEKVGVAQTQESFRIADEESNLEFTGVARIDAETGIVLGISGSISYIDHEPDEAAYVGNYSSEGNIEDDGTRWTITAPRRYMEKILESIDASVQTYINKYKPNYEDND